MFKNKKITYLLIVLTVMIWGVIFYKIYSGLGGQKLVENSLVQPVPEVERGQEYSAFSLSLNYPDPFLSGLDTQTDYPISLESENTITPQPVSWPIIEFRGLLTNNDKKESTGLLKVGNSNFLVKQGTEYSAVKVRIITSDSVLLEYQKAIRWFPIMKK